MPRHILFGLVFLTLISLLGASYYYNLQKRIQELMRPAPERAPYLAVPPAVSASAPLRKVRLFFPSIRQDNLLESEEREIRSSELSSEEAKQIVAELIAGPKAGPKEGRLAALPSETRLRELFVTTKGLAVVDLTREASLHHPGGLTLELASIYSVVNSLTQNVSGIESVQILIEGAEAETLAGHIDLSHPFAEDLSMTALGGAPKASSEAPVGP
ncbi:MAG: GerMN domain-containing protein [Acidobacteria bacterium]|nr:GerMN domain-containing protein [Acidobacteriota bacterium]MCI0624168.1 GerMN domain-containing protein [Acidobacteriota bacterium]MCI0719744.1 GerMN domain-containing protein [Acidobacteriota bacterium]